MYWQLGCTRAMLCSISMNSPVRSDSSAGELGKQHDVVQPFSELVLPCAAGLCL
jgi:hypothetical protein